MNNNSTTKEEKVITDFQYKNYIFYDNTLIIDWEYKFLVEVIIKIKRLVKQIIRSEGALFLINENAKGIKTIKCKIPKFFEDLRELIEQNIIEAIALRFSMHRLNPYVNLYIKNMTANFHSIEETYQHLRCGKLYDNNILVKYVDILNDFINSIRREAEIPEFKASLGNYKRPFNKNYKSLKDYINELFKDNTRLLVLRMDFHYRKDVFNPYLTEIERNERYWQAKKDLEHLTEIERKEMYLQAEVKWQAKLDLDDLTEIEIKEMYLLAEMYSQAKKGQEDLTEIEIKEMYLLAEMYSQAKKGQENLTEIERIEMYSQAQAKKDLEHLTEIERKEMYSQAKKDLENFLNKSRKKKKIFRHMLGYAWKLEYARLTGFHYHLFFFFNEKEVQLDGIIAKNIGDYWKDTITQGRGLYFNCNDEAIKKMYKFLGIGEIHRNDVELREELKKAAEYVTKVDENNVRLIALEKNGRTFDRKKLPKEKKKT